MTRKATRRATAAAQLDFELLFRAVPARCLVLDRELRIVAASNDYMQATMVSLESVRGRIIFEAFPDDPNDPDATGERNLRDSLIRVIETRASDTMAVQRYPIRQPDGSFEERYWSPVNFPVVGRDGEVEYIIHRVEDVTDLLRLRNREALAGSALTPEERLEADVLRRAQEIQEANRRLRERHRKDQEDTAVVLQSIVDTAIDGIITIDEHGTMLTFNRAAADMFGYVAEETVGRNVNMLMPPPYRDAHDGYLKAYLTTGVAKIIGIGREVVGRRKDGSTFPMELAVSRFEQDGRSCFTGLVRDITDRKRMESQLQQAQKMEAIGQLAAGVAHDFNNLLTVISGYSDLVLLSLSPHDPTRSMIQEVRQASERAAALTGQLLAFSRQQVLEMRDFDLNPLIVDSERMLKRLLGENIHVESSLAPDLYPVRADPGQISQVVMNLAVNARDAMPLGGRITIETCNADIGGDSMPTHAFVPPGTYVVLTMTDSGCGMAPEIVPRIFDPFFTTKEVGKGTGLGLSVVHGIVKQCGGHVDVYSEVGIGTAFKVYLPVAPAVAVAIPSPAPPLTERGSETILVVEDDVSVRGFTVLTLRQFGYDVAEARGGEEALQLLSTFGGKPDLLITDVVMPGMSGRELAEAVKKKFPALKVLYMSGYTNDAIVRHGVLAAELQFLHKPFTHGALMRKVREVLDAS